MQFVSGGRCGADRRFIAVQFGRRDDASREADGYVPGLPALELVEADDIAAAVLGFLQGAERHAFAAHFGKTEGLAQGAGVLLGGEGLDGLVQGLGPGGGAALPAIARVGGDRVGKPVLPMVLAVLVGIAAARLGRMQERQAQDVVSRLVPAVFAVVQDGDAVGSVGLGQVRPLLGVHLILFAGVVRTLDGAGADVVTGHRVGDGKRELGLEEGVGPVPVDLVDDVDALFVGTVIQADVLREMRVSETSFHLQRSHDRAVLGHGDPHVAVHGRRGPVDGLFQDFPGRPLEGLVLREHRQPDGFSFGDELPAVALVHQGANIAVGVQAQAVHSVLKGGSPRF